MLLQHCLPGCHASLARAHLHELKCMHSCKCCALLKKSSFLCCQICSILWSIVWAPSCLFDSPYLRLSTEDGKKSKFLGGTLVSCMQFVVPTPSILNLQTACAHALQPSTTSFSDAILIHPWNTPTKKWLILQSRSAAYLRLWTDWLQDWSPGLTLCAQIHLR